MEGRYQTLASREQCLFGPDSPVWVSRWRLTRDGETRRLLLQVRLVNLSGKTVRRVFLRVACRDGEGRLLKELCLLPMAEVSAGPGRQFGDDCPLELAVPGTREVEIYPQRVTFSGGGAWDERPRANYIAFRPAERLLPSDGDFAELKRRAAEGGVRSEYRFRRLGGLWLCTCGLPNADRRLTCARCGADREWLEGHMDPGKLSAAPDAVPAEASPFAPAAVRSAPEPAAVRTAPEPAAAVPLAIGLSPAGAEASVGRSAFPASVIPAPPMPAPPAAPAPARAAKPARTEEVPPPALDSRPRRGGRLTVILLLVLAVLAVAAFAAATLAGPYLRYRAALGAQQSGDYEQAQKLFEELDDYRDSAERAAQSVAAQAVEKMNEGEFEEALAILEDLKGFDGEKAKCLYSIAVLAHNDGQLDKAWDYIRRLEDLDPDYPDLPLLRRSCNYARGIQICASAAAEYRSQTRIEQFNQAIQYFELAEGYEKSAEKILYCRYEIAAEEVRYAETSGSALVHLERAVEGFAALGDYQDAADRVLDCKYAYVYCAFKELGDFDDEKALAYLEELRAANYPGAEELNEGLTEAFELYVVIPSYSSVDPSLPVTSFTGIKIWVEQPPLRAWMPLMLYCTFPDGNSGIGYVSPDGETTRILAWEDYLPTDCAASGTVRLVLYNAAKDYREPLAECSFEYTAPTPPAEGGD